MKKYKRKVTTHKVSYFHVISAIIMQNRLIVQNVLDGLYIKINLDHYYYSANNSLHFELTVALSRTRLSASDNKESMEGPGAQSNNKQQFNDCHDGSPGTGQMKGQPPMSRPRQPPHSTGRPVIRIPAPRIDSVFICV